eukprot:TRINITY_DN21852_c0_g1_i1.p1 TRINITY_DN21852_c0_g1~~TRINITY_DN21852_c0_g1_i1.p1  ORF type:complete len:325 (+),score=66.61 TRINITY_DN21852_c0_g1_i1:205-1179(+)
MATTETLAETATADEEHDGRVVVDLTDLRSDDGSEDERGDAQDQYLFKGSGQVLGEAKHSQSPAGDGDGHSDGESDHEEYSVGAPLAKSNTSPAAYSTQVGRTRSFSELISEKAKAREGQKTALANGAGNAVRRANSFAFGDGKKFTTRHEELEVLVKVRKQRSVHADRLFRQAVSIVDRAKERKAALERTHKTIGLSGVPDTTWLVALNGAEDGLGSIPELQRPASGQDDSGGYLPGARLSQIDLVQAAKNQAAADLQKTLVLFGWEPPQATGSPSSRNSLAKLLQGQELSLEALVRGSPAGRFPTCPDLEKLSRTLKLRVQN